MRRIALALALLLTACGGDGKNGRADALEACAIVEKTVANAADLGEAVSTELARAEAKARSAASEDKEWGPLADEIRRLRVTRASQPGTLEAVREFCP